jgi:RNA polymerase sigma-70 factor (ECF subfamily)
MGRLAVARVDLVQSAQSGDQESFRLLVEPHLEALLRSIYRIVHHESDAQDILQETLVRAFLSIGNFKGNSSFKTWLFRISYNLAIDFLRKNKRNPEELNETALNNVKAGDSPEKAAEMSLELSRVSAGLKRLSPEHREALLLREVDGLSYEEIAEVMGVSQGTVMSRLFYAREKLLGLLGETK